MNREPEQPVLLTLIIAPDVEESVVDWILARGDEGFSTIAGHGHGVTQAELSVAERVAGRQARCFVEIQTTLQGARDLLAAFSRDYEGARVHYWIAPLLEAGPLGIPDPES